MSNRYALALVLTRRLDRLDPATRAEAERIVDAVEAGRAHSVLLKAFFPDAWARCGRAAAAASTPKSQRATTAHLAVLAELESVLGLAPKAEPDPASNSTESEHVPETDPVSVTDTEWSAA